MPTEQITRNKSFSPTLLDVLRDHRPALNVSSAEDALKLASKEELGLVVIVDDLNTAEMPEQVLDIIHQWANVIQVNVPKARIKFIVPVWTGVLKNDDSRNWMIVEVSNFSNAECKRLSNIQAENASEQNDYQQIYESLQGDPFLCGLVTRKLFAVRTAKKPDLIHDIFHEFLNIATDDVKANIKPGERPTSSELMEVVAELAQLVLETDEPNPNLSMIKNKVTNFDFLRNWSASRKLGWLDKIDNDECWHWKHNRLRDALVGRFLATHYLNGDFNEFDAYSFAWLSNPGLAEAWAMAVVFLTQENERVQLLQLLAKYQPISLAEILRLRLFPDEELPRNIILQGLRDTLSTHISGSLYEIEKPSIWDTSVKLAGASDSLVLTITDDVSLTISIYAARVRNGDTRAGLNWIKAHKHEFLPFFNYPLLESSIVAYSSLRNDERDAVAQEIAHQAQGKEFIESSFIFAGYLAWEETAQILLDVWNTFTENDKLDHLVSFVWMLSRCANKKTRSALEEALSLVRLLPDDRENQGSSERQNFSLPIEAMFRSREWRVTTAAAQAWVNAANEFPDIQPTLHYIMRVIDHPTTLDAFVRWMTQQGTKWFFPGDSMSVSPLPRRNLQPERIARNIETRERLWNIIVDQNDESRSTAFWYWRFALSSADLGKLQSIRKDDPLFDKVLKARLVLGDKTATHFLMERMELAPHEWCDYAIFVIDELGVFETLFKKLEEIVKGWNSVELIQHLSSAYVERILKEKGEMLSRYPKSWYHLWRTDVPQALIYVGKQLANTNSANVEHFFSQGESPFPVSRRMLDCMASYLHLFGKHDLWSLSESAMRSGHIQWVHDHIVGRHSDEIRWTTQEEIWNALDQAAQSVPDGEKAMRSVHDFQRLLFWDDLYRGDAPNKALREWLKHNQSSEAMIVGAILLFYVGSPGDIKWWKTLEPWDEKSRDYWQCTMDQLVRSKWQA